MNPDTEKLSATNDAAPKQEPPITEELTQTAILRLKAAEASEQKTDGDHDTGYSITAAYLQAVQGQQNTLSKHKKTMHTYKLVKAIIAGILLLAVMVGGIFFIMNHLPNIKESKSIEEQLTDSKWDTDALGNFNFTDNRTVTRRVSGKTETGSYELTDSNVLIMHFNKEDLSYLIEFDSDGNMRWVHSYNGVEDVIYPTAIPKTDSN